MYLSNYDWALNCSDAQMRALIKCLKSAVEEYEEDAEYSELEGYEADIAKKMATTLGEQRQRKQAQRVARMKRKALYRESRERDDESGFEAGEDQCEQEEENPYTQRTLRTH
jgi:hypothetical protein